MYVILECHGIPDNNVANGLSITIKGQGLILVDIVTTDTDTPHLAILTSSSIRIKALGPVTVIVGSPNTADLLEGVHNDGNPASGVDIASM